MGQFDTLEVDFFLEDSAETLLTNPAIGALTLLRVHNTVYERGLTKSRELATNVHRSERLRPKFFGMEHHVERR